MGIYTARDAFLRGIRPVTEAQGAGFRVLAEAARLAAKTHPAAQINPFARYFFEQSARNADASAESIERPFRKYPDPGFNLTETTIDGKAVAVEQTVEMSKPFCDLVHWERETNRNDPKLLLIGPYSGHYFSLLRDTVQEFLPHHDIYGTDWKNARDVSLEDAPRFNQDDQILYMKEFLEHLGPDTHVMAVCQPTYGLIAALSLMAAEGKPLPASLTLMAGPVDVGTAHSEVAEFPKSPYFSPFMQGATSTVPLGYKGAGREVHMSSAQLLGFMLPNMDTHLHKQLEIHVKKLIGDEEGAQRIIDFYNDYFAVLDMPKEFIEQTIQRVFVDRELAVGTLVVDGKPIDPTLIKDLPILTVEGKEDPISPLGHTKAAHKIMSSIPADKRFHHEEDGAKHYSCFSGSRWRNSISKYIAGMFRKFPTSEYTPLPQEKEVFEPKHPVAYTVRKSQLKPAVS